MSKKKTTQGKEKVTFWAKVKGSKKVKVTFYARKKTTTSKKKKKR